MFVLHSPKVGRLLGALLFAFVALFAFSTSAVYADRIVQPNEVVEGDINASDDLIVSADGTIIGNVHLLNSDAKVDGTIDGNLLVVGGDVYLAETAAISGSCVVLNGKVEQNDSTIDCQEARDLEIGLPGFVDPDIPALIDTSRAAAEMAAAPRSIGSVLLSSIAFGLLAFAATMFAPERLATVGDTITANPVSAGVFGGLTFAAAFSVAIIISIVSAILLFICVGILGVPIVLAIVALVGLGILFGWLAVGRIFGELIVERMHLHHLDERVVGAIGTVALSLAIGLIRLLPAGGFGATMAILIIAGIGLGATTLTRFGSRAYPVIVVHHDKVNSVFNTVPDDENLL